MSWREYPTQCYIAQADAVSQSTVGRTIQPVENRLIQCRPFRRPSKRELLASQTNIQGVIVDVSEQPTERAKITDTASPTNHQPTPLSVEDPNLIFSYFRMAKRQSAGRLVV